MSGFNGAFELAGGLVLRLARPSDETFLFQLFTETRPWLSWAEGDRDFIRLLYEQQYKTMTVGQQGAYPEHMDLIIEHLCDPVGRVVVNLGYSDWRIAELQVRAGAQGKGIGANVVRGLQAAATRASVPLSLSAPRGFRTYRLYERLGFRISSTDGASYHLAWHPREQVTAGRT